MKKIFRKTTLFIFVATLSSAALAQKNSNLPVITADSLAGGNYRDIFKSFFQLSFNRITGPKKEIQFTSNPFALMAKANPEMLVDTNYVKYKALRNLNFAFSVNLDTSYRFAGFSSGIKYAIINRRDYTVSKAFITEAFNANHEFSALTTALGAYASLHFHGAELTAFITEVNNLLQGKVTFDKVSPALQKEIRDYASTQNAGYFINLIDNDPKVNFKKASQQSFDDIVKTFEKKLLWTIDVSDTTYKDQFFFSNLVFSTELVKGILKPSNKSNLEINVQSALQCTDDTLKNGRDLKRALFNFAPGLNFVLKSKGTNQSFLEFKLAGNYMHNFGNLYTNERRDSLTLDATLRIRVYNDIWIPIDIKYDPRNGNFFGFFNVRANFTGLKKLLKGSD